MNIACLHGIGSNAEPNVVYAAGYNAEGANVPVGTPVFWDAVASDANTFKLSLTANVKLFAGVTGEAVGTTEYTAKIVAYGPTDCAVWGIASTMIPGAGLYHTATKDYLEYGTEGQLGAPINAVRLVALETAATAALYTVKTFIGAL